MRENESITIGSARKAVKALGDLPKNAHCRACGKRGATRMVRMLVPTSWAVRMVPVHQDCMAEAEGDRARLPPVPGE